MDYDDNDFQSQTFQLVGEENTKFPPGLRSYSLPKFDLDDNLQVNLRFDSLVESEVLLGIQSQEENQWIEDFSGGSSGIEFSSSAAESCSISRRNNVWSEATSSESVEMLLKSVGQDEMIMGQTIIEESEAGDGPGNLTKQMDHNSSQDGCAPSNIEDAVDVDSILPTELSKDAADQLPLADATSLTGEGEKSGYGSLRDLGTSSVSEKCSLPVTEGNLFVDGKCKEANPMEDIPLDRSEGIMAHDYSIAYKNMHLDPSAASVRTLAENAGELNNQLGPPQAEGLQEDNTDKVGENLAVSKEAEMDDQNSKADEVETSVNNVLNESILEQKVDSTIQESELNGEGFFTDSSVHMSKWEGVVSSSDNEKGDLFIGNVQEASLFMVGSEARSVDIDRGIFSNPVPTTDLLEQITQGYSNIESSEKRGDSLEDDGHRYPSEQITQVHSNIESSERPGSLLPDDGHKLISGISVSNTESLTAEEHKTFKGQGNVSNIAVSSSLVVVSSSANIIDVSQATGNMKDDDDVGLRAHKTDIGTEGQISSPMHVEYMQTCNRMIIGVEASDVQITHSDASLLEEENARTPTDPGNVECEPDGSRMVSEKVSPSSVGQNVAITEVMVHETLSVQVLADESVSACVVSDVTKSDSVTDVPSGSCVVLDEVIERVEDAKSPLLIKEFSHLEKKKETVSTISLEPSSSVVKVRSQMANESVPAPEFEQGAVCENAGEMLYEIVGQSLSPLGIVSTACQNKPQETVAQKATLEGSRDLYRCPVIDESLTKENDGAEVVGVSSVEHEGAVLKITGSNSETLKQQIPLSLEESSNDAGPKSLEDKEASGDNNHGQSPLAGTESDALNVCGDTFGSAMVRDESEFHPMEAGSDSPNSNEPNCGSPTVISCSEPSPSGKENQDVGRESLDQNNAPICEANKVASVALDPKEKNASEDDRSFTFEVGTLPDLSERTDNDWRPFPSVQPYESLQTAQGSPPRTSSLCRIDSKILPRISHVSPRKSGGRNAHKSSKSRPADDTTPASAKAADRETSNEGGPLKDVAPQCEKEHQEGGKGWLDHVSPVSDGIDRAANQVSSTCHDPRKDDVSRDDRSFTFEVSSQAHLSEKETGNGLKPFPSPQPYGFPQTVGASPSTAGLGQMGPKILQEISRGNARISGVKNERRRSRGEDKTRPVSGKVAGRESAKERKLFEEITPTKQIKDRGSISFSATPSSFGVVSRVVQAEEMRPFGFIESSSAKPSPVPTVQTSNLPDLNTSASTSVFFQQPFTDSQQVQLRAQIFVYGSLIQGTAPDEAYMVSAFGESDGGRNAWENVWRVSVERLQHQKSPLGNSETPLHFHSGARTPAQTTRQSFHQSEALTTPGRASSKGVPPAIVNPVIPMSSPIWTFSTPSREGLYSSSMMTGPLIDSHQTLLPLHPYQSPHLRHYIGNASPWQSQAPAPATWVVTPQSTPVDANAKQSAVPVSETVHVTSVRESSVSRSSVVQPVPPAKHSSAEQKPRKRKKSPASVELGQISSIVQPQAESVSAIGGHHLPTSVAITTPSSSAPKVTGGHHLPTSVAITTPSSSAPKVTGGHHLPTSVAITTPSSSEPKVAGGSFVLTTPPVLPTHFQIIAGPETEQRVIFSEETCSKIEQAKQHAEDAAALAASAVKHSQTIWSQLAIQKNSGLVSDVEAKLASAAVAIAAAAAVAKAAAAAAKVASDAALQAKLMADEALVSSKLGNMTSEASLHNGVKNLGKVSPASILKGKDRTNSSDSVLVAAREAAKKRVEAASAATKRAENLDAVVKAAEMAAEAVSQAGTIIAMGDPIPLKLHELVEAGPEGYWKAQHTSSEQLVKSKSNTTIMEQSDIGCAEKVVNKSAEHFSEHQLKDPTEQGEVLPPKEMSKQPVESNMWLVNDMRWGSVASSEKGLGGPKLGKTSELAQSIGLVSESQIGPTNASINVQNKEYGVHQSIRTFTENNIKEGSSVEVLSYEEGLRKVWFPAKVLSLKDGKAFVCYPELARDEGTGQSKEWVPLEGEGGKAPRIRIPHPMSVLKYEGTRKRRKAARGDYAWSVGDQVDAWIRDGWWEGTITEKGTEDETNLTVQFSAQGDISVVRSWNLRPSLIWKDGHWMEWSSSRENTCHEGDTPQEKRAKLGTSGAEIDPAIEARGKDKMTKHMGIEDSGKPETSRPLALSAKEKIFTIGKNIREDNNSDALGTKRIGLQKEGSRVVFGVPKPGKKRKFMEVSKHYVANRGAKASEGNDSIKFTKFLIPQESAQRGWKNPSKVVNKGKRVAESKPKVLKSGKAQNVMGRNASERDNSSTSVFPASTEGAVQDLLPNAQASVTHDGNLLEKQKLLELGSFPSTRKAAEAQVSSSLSDVVSDAPSLKKKSSSAVATNPGNKGKFAPPGQRLARNEEKDSGHNDNSGKLIPDAVEPRRSNRRIQPTSRLLEGLQSSLIISKIPVASHDRGTKAQHRSAGSSRGEAGL
ncbi:Agenet-like domain [Macleaya cordata]|uniref:Agenet-like domain n=1 Tax=Macleaya cordata TaxID=56857 RepID=A0A200PY75_MACCD|nr:Agenet-like domain [Macleaya cordata]